MSIAPPHAVKPVELLHPCRAQAGLSLVEVMVTLSVIAVATSLILLTVPNRSTHLRESDLLRDVLERNAERALVTGQPMGLVVDHNSYTTAIWQNNEWSIVRGRRLPADMDILIDGKPAETADPEDPVVPDVVFDPLGHTEPVDIVLARHSHLTSLTLQPDGTVKVEFPQ